MLLMPNRTQQIVVSLQLLSQVLRLFIWLYVWDMQTYAKKGVKKVQEMQKTRMWMKKLKKSIETVTDIIAYMDNDFRMSSGDAGH